MRRSVLTACGLCFSLLMTMNVTLGAKPNIVDYYRDLPEQYLDNNKYDIQQREGQWVTLSDPGPAVKPVVDIKNGYLQLKDHGTGGGTLEQTLALFRDKAGSDLLGLTIRQFDGVGTTCRLQFLQPKAGAWQNATAQVMPAPALKEFFDPGYDLNLKRAENLFEGIVVLYQLPRVGTTMIAEINLDRFIMLQNSESEQKPAAAVMPLLQNLKYQRVSLPWDKTKGRFSVGKKDPYAPSEQVKAYLAAHADQASPQDRGSADDPRRAAILEGLRQSLYGQSGMDMVFDVRYLQVIGDWAWIHVLPSTRDGQSNFEDMSALMQKTEGGWKVLDMPSGEGDQEGPQEDPIAAMKKRHPQAPAEIFPAAGF